jgi:hypothetical protein
MKILSKNMKNLSKIKNLSKNIKNLSKNIKILPKNQRKRKNLFKFKVQIIDHRPNNFSRVLTSPFLFFLLTFAPLAIKASPCFLTEEAKQNLSAK